VFVAVEISEAARGEVARLQETLRAAGADVKWVEPKNLHLTLKFLGEISEKQARELEEGLRGAAGGISPFDFSLEGVGAFPNISRPQVVWVGVSSGKEKLAELAGAVENCCAGLGFPAEERPFSSHLTIGRVRSGKRPAGLTKKLQQATFRAEETARAQEVVLFQSTLSPRGSLYAPLARFHLGPS